MKTNLLIIIVATTLLSGELIAQSTPQEITKTFFKAIQKKDIEKAKSVTHSMFHNFLGMMADAKLKEGADTVDRIDYKNLEFKTAGTGGIIKYKKGADEEVLFLAKEDNAWKVDLFGTATDYQVGVLLIELSPEIEEGSIQYIMELVYEVGGFVMNKTITGELKANRPMTRNFPGNNIRLLKVESLTANTKLKVSVGKAKDQKAGDMHYFIEDTAVEHGKAFIYSNN